MNWLRALFGCRHKRITFPLTVRSAGETTPKTYVVCLGCGQRFDYSWKEMRRGPEALKQQKEQAREHLGALNGGKS